MKRCMRLKQNLIGHTVVLILLIRLVLKAYDDDNDYDGLLSIEQAGTKNYYATSFIQTGKHLKTTPLYIIEYKYLYRFSAKGEHCCHTYASALFRSTILN